MAILKFRVYLEEDEATYRDVAISHKQTFLDFHKAILLAYEFDQKHQATFYRSNDAWEKGREISFETYEKEYVVAPLIMNEVQIGKEVFDPNQKFIYHYDFAKGWSFLILLVEINKEENPRLTYPCVTRKEGIAPPQYGTKGLLGEKFIEIEEKYDLSGNEEGFGTEGENLPVEGEDK
jgi:hypothetical protein